MYEVAHSIARRKSGIGEVGASELGEEGGGKGGES